MRTFKHVDDMWDVTVKARGVAATGRPFAAAAQGGSYRVGLGSQALVFQRLGGPHSVGQIASNGSSHNAALVSAGDPKAPSLELQVCIPCNTLIIDWR